jgi:S-adenosylmethionine hydrolase
VVFIMAPLITLTTDFGERSPYVAVMKGVVLSLNADARILDLSHLIPPQDVRSGNYFLATAVPYYPPGTVHVAVVDPGVGTQRGILLAEVAGQFVLAPDNGVLTGLFERHPPTTVRRLTEAKYWRPTVSATFHGRDIFAPVAAHLSLDPRPALFGVPVMEWVRLPGEPYRVEGERVVGSIQAIDHFGNLISNIPAAAVPSAPSSVTVGGRDVPLCWVRTYGEAAAGELVGLVSSDGSLEIAIVNGSAAARLDIEAGAAVAVEL